MTDENGNTIEAPAAAANSDSEVEGDNKPFEELPEEDIAAMDEDARIEYEAKASAFRAMRDSTR